MDVQGCNCTHRLMDRKAEGRGTLRYGFRHHFQELMRSASKTFPFMLFLNVLRPQLKNRRMESGTCWGRPREKYNRRIARGYNPPGHPSDRMPFHPTNCMSASIKKAHVHSETFVLKCLSCSKKKSFSLQTSAYLSAFLVSRGRLMAMKCHLRRCWPGRTKMESPPLSWP